MPKRFLNLGCGKMILPAPRPGHYRPEFVGELTQYPYWHNVDLHHHEGVNEVTDLYSYEWDWGDERFGGALLAHFAEHIPHTAYDRQGFVLQGDGFFHFFSELWRVLEPHSLVYIIAPHGTSDGALIDPTHTRYLFPHTFAYLTQEQPAEAPFTKGHGGRWEIVNANSLLTPYGMGLVQRDDNYAAFNEAVTRDRNVFQEFLVILERLP